MVYIKFNDQKLTRRAQRGRFLYIYYEYSITNCVLQSNLQLKLSTIILYIFLLWHAGGKGLESNKRQD